MVLAYSLASIFVTVFFFSHSTLAITAAFRAITFGSMVLFFSLIGYLLRHISAGVLIKIALVANAAFYLLLVVLKEQSVRWYIPLAIFDGASGGIFWAAYNLYQYIISSSGRRVAYFGWGQVMSNLGNALGPAVGGFIIASAAHTSMGLTGGYTMLFFTVASVYAIAAMIVGKLPAHRDISFSYSHILAHKRSIGWKLVLGQQALLGLYDVSIGTVNGVLLYLIIRSESRLGIILSIGSVIAILGSIMVTRTMVKNPNSYWIGVLGSAVAIWAFASQQNMLGVWLLLGIGGLSVPFMMTKLSTAYFDALDEAPGTWENKFHMMIERDGLLGILRMMSYTILFFVLRGGNEIAIARTWLYIIPVIPLGIGVLLSLGARKKKVMVPAPPLPNENI